MWQMDYVKLLEQQNEELQKKLAEAEKFHAWRDARHYEKFYYEYKLICSDNPQFDYPSELYVSNISARNILRYKAEYIHIKDIEEIQPLLKKYYHTNKKLCILRLYIEPHKKFRFYRNQLLLEKQYNHGS